LVYRIAVTMFGGFGPFVVTSLTETSGSPLAPTYYLMRGLAASIAAVASMQAIVTSMPTHARRKPFTSHHTA
jgi:MHS family proline/betaine transporter-like MFS transporter